MNRYIHSHRKLVGFVGVLAVTLVLAGTAMAQEEMRSQVNLQFTGLIPKDSSGNGITDHATRSGGLLAGYAFNLNRWAAVEGDYGYSRNTQTYSGLFGTSAIQAGVHELMGVFLLRIPAGVSRVRPYALAGTGALRFNPTSNLGNTPGALVQSKGVFVYGGGVNFDVARHMGVRAEYRGLLAKVPDFKLTGLTLGTMNHIAQPSVGIFFRF
jgi:opacity protein-like surface antigen